MSAVMVWQDPPAIPARRLARFVAQLHTNPGQWALYPHPTSSSGTVTRNTRRYPATEWTGRCRPDGRWDIYGRSTGGVS